MHHHLQMSKFLPRALSVLGLSLMPLLSFAQSQDQHSQKQSYERDDYNNNEFRDDMRDRTRTESDLRNDSRDNAKNYSNRNGQDPNQDKHTHQEGNDRPAGLGVMLHSYRDEVEVREVASNSPADRAGIQRGDIILAVNSRRVESVE